MLKSLLVVLALPMFAAACQADMSTAPADTRASSVPIPHFTNQQLAPLSQKRVGPNAPSLSVESECQCGAWSCQENICGNDPAIYGACCVACAYDTGSVVPRPSCDGTPVGQPSCNSSTWGSCEVEHPDYFCPAPCACCYFREIA